LKNGGNQICKYHKDKGHKGIHGSGQLFVDNIHIAAKTVQESPDRSDIEEAADGAPDYDGQQIIVDGLCRLKAAKVDDNHRKVG